MASRRNGRRRIEKMEVRHEGNLYRVDIYMVSNEFGRSWFEASHPLLEEKVKNEDINALRKAATAAMKQAVKAEWSVWIEYQVERDDPDTRGNRSTISLKWNLLERCDVGLPTERHRVPTTTSFGVQTEYRTMKGPPHVGEKSPWGGGSEPTTFYGLVPHSKEVEEGLLLINQGINAMYVRLRDLLCPDGKNDPAKTLAHVARSPSRYLPSLTGTK